MGANDEQLEDEPPWQEDQEWANALTHGVAAAVTLMIGGYMISLAASRSTGMVYACFAYVASAFATFLCSTLSHVIRHQPLLNTMRAWDQAMIYAMISGTYTPIVYRYAADEILLPLLVAIWAAAAAGFVTKVALRHRVNSIGSISYLLLGWLPAIPLAGQVPSGLAWSMLAGGVMYSVGVILLLNDSRLRYLHAGWHICVMTAAMIHYFGILYYVVVTS